MGIFDFLNPAPDPLPSLKEGLRRLWGLPDLEPADENMSFRNWISPFVVAGMNDFVAALRDSGGVRLALPAAGWGEVVGAMLTALFAQEKVAMSDAGAELAVSEEGFRLGDAVLRSENSVPFLALQLAQALSFTRSELFDRTLVAYDLEATGLGTRDELTEVGAIRIKNGVIIDEFQSLINPGQRIPPDIVELTNITNDMVKGAPSCREVIGKFLAFFGDNDTIAVVHNGGFDINSIRKRARKYYNRDFSPRVFDTRQFAQSVRPMMSASLNMLALDFGIDLKNAHRALADATATGKVFIKAYSVQNVYYRQYLKKGMRLFAIAQAAWPGAEGEAERGLLYHLFLNRKKYGLWPSLADIDQSSFHRYRAGIAAAASTVIAGTDVQLAPQHPEAAELPGVYTVETFTPRFVHTLEKFQPYLRHNPSPLFLMHGGSKVHPKLAPHPVWRWLWPKVVLER